MMMMLVMMLMMMMMMMTMLLFVHVGVSINGGTQKWLVYNGNSNKMDDWGVPLF